LHLNVRGPRVTLKPKAALAISMVVHELAINAAKYGSLSQEGGKLTVEWSFGSENGKEALVIWWTESHGPRVATPSRSSFGRLVIERSLAHELEGEVKLSFDPKGVRCHIRIPAQHLVSSEEPSNPADAQAKPMAAGRPNRILLVEDSMLTALDLATSLRQRGYQIVGPVGRLEEALKLAQNESIDAAILDIDLGENDSFDVADALHLRGIPFVFLSGYEASHVLPQRFATREVVPKPYAGTDLEQALKAAVQSSRT
jgi:CheY-like chemotaxis protein